MPRPCSALRGSPDGEGRLAREGRRGDGPGGFAGSHLAEELVRRGARVRALVRYASHGGAGWLEDCPAELRGGLTVERGDVRNPRRMRELVDGVDVIFHLAAVISVPWSFVDPREVVDVNVMGTLTVLEAAREARTPRVVQVSSSEVYADAAHGPDP